MEFEDKTQEMKMINQITLNKIEDLYRISNQIEFYEKICHNTQNISKILSIINKMLNEKIVLSKKESEILLHCLNFVDLMNLFINPNEMDKLCTNIKSIKEQISIINNLELKEDILKKIKYTDKSFIYYKKKMFKNLFFKDSNTIYKEFDEMFNNLMDQRYLKQLQNAFYIFSLKIEEDKRTILQGKINILREKNKKMKKTVEQGWHYNNFQYNYNNRNYYSHKNEKEIELNCTDEPLNKHEIKEYHNNSSHLHPYFSNNSNSHYKYNIYNNYSSHKEYNNYYNNGYNSYYNQNFKHNSNYYSNKTQSKKLLGFENYYEDQGNLRSAKNIDQNSIIYNENKINNIKEKPNEISPNDEQKRNKVTNSKLNSSESLQNKLNDYYNQHFFSDYIYYNKSSNTFAKGSTTETRERIVNKSSNYIREFRNNKNTYSNDQYIGLMYASENSNLNQCNNSYNNFNDYQQQIKNINNKELRQDLRPKSYSLNTDPRKNMNEITLINDPTEQKKELNNEDFLQTKNYLQVDVDKMFQAIPSDNQKNNKKIDEKIDCLTTGSIYEKKPSSFKTPKKYSIDKSDLHDFNKLNDSFNSENLDEEEEKIKEFMKKHREFKIDEANEDESLSDESDEISLHDEGSEENNSDSDTKNNKVIFDYENSTPQNFSNNTKKEIGIDDVENLKKNLDSDPFYSQQEIRKIQTNDNNLLEMFQINDKNLTNYQNYIFSNYANFFYRGRDSNIHREYFTLKCLEQEKPQLILKLLDDFESKILIPIYQKIIVNVEKKKKYYYYTFNKYKNIIYKVLNNDKVLSKVEPYGSHVNNFLIDLSDIDICIVPRCPLSDFNIYLEKLKEYIVSKVKNHF